MRRNIVVTLCIAVGIVVTGICGLIMGMNVDKKDQNSKMEQVSMSVDSSKGENKVDKNDEKAIAEGTSEQSLKDSIKNTLKMVFDGITFEVDHVTNLDEENFEIPLESAVNIGLEYIKETYGTTYSTIDVQMDTTATSGILSGSVAWNGVIEIDGDKRFEIAINTQTGEVMEVQKYYKENDKWVKEENSSDRKEYKVEKLNLEAFSSIDVNLEYNADVEIIKGDYYGVIIHYMGPDYSINYTNQDGKLRIDDSGPILNKGITINIQQGKNKNYVTIIVPEDVKLSNIDIEAGSGDISMKDINVEQLYSLAYSGDSTLVNIIANEGDIQAYSGDIDVKDLQSSTVKISSISGDITVKGKVYGNSTFDATSGDIVLACEDREKKYSYNLSTTSGSIMVNDDEVEEDIGARINVQNSNENIIKATSISGDIDIVFDK